MAETAGKDIARLLAKRGARGFSALIQALVFIVIIAITTTSIGQIAARQQFQSAVASQINTLRAQYVELRRNGSSDSASQQELQIIEKEISIMRRIASMINLLIASGSGGAVNTLRKLQEMETNSRYLSIMAIKNSDDASIVDTVFKGDPRESFFWQVVASSTGYIPDIKGPLLLHLFTINAKNTDQLLAIAVMGCGAIGSIIAGLRANTLVTFRNLSLGLASGFVIFLGLKGGRHFFLVQAAVDQVAFNPYSCAFAGLLAGLFTERTYSLLSSVVDELVKKIETAVKG
jgi:hypothetical protein